MRTKLVIGLLCAGLLAGATVPALANHNGNSRDNNVPICHRGRTIYVNPSAVPAHLRHGDTEGPCQGPATATATTAASEATATTAAGESTPTDTPEPVATPTEPSVEATPTDTVEATPTDTVEPVPTATLGGAGAGLRLRGRLIRFSFW